MDIQVHIQVASTSSHQAAVTYAATYGTILRLEMAVASMAWTQFLC